MTQFELELIRGPVAGRDVRGFPGGEPPPELFYDLESTGTVGWQARYKLHEVDLGAGRAVYVHVTNVRV